MAGAVAPLRIVSIAESGPGSLTHTGRSRELGTPVMLFEAGPRILSTGDEDISRVMAACFRAAGMDVRERFGPVHRFDKTPVGVCLAAGDIHRQAHARATSRAGRLPR